MSTNGDPVFFPARFIQTCILLLFVLVLCQPALAGVLDPTFGTGGRVTFDLSGGGVSSYGREVFVQPSGRIVVRANVLCSGGPGPGFFTTGYAFIGLTPNGALDTAFGINGQIYNCVNNLTQIVTDIKMLPDGKFLVLSYSQLNTSQNRSPFLTLRDQNGNAIGAGNIALGSDTFPNKMSPQDDGKFMVMVSVGFSRYLIRLNSDGSRDQTFGESGVRSLPGRLPNVSVADIASTPDGKTMIAFTDGTVARFDGNGYPDRTFGNLGVAKLYFDPDLPISVQKALLQPDGKMLLIGYVSTSSSFNIRNVFMARFTSRGKVDGSFGSAGIVVSDFTPDGDDYAMDGVLIQDGKIVISGRATFPLISHPNFLIAKYSAGGTLEAVTKTIFLTSPDSDALGIAVQPNGKIVAAGGAGQGSTLALFGMFVGVARFNEITDSEKTIKRLYDFDGDGVTDRSVYRQDPANVEQSFWDIFTSRNNSVYTFFGLNGDIPVPSDFNDDGKTDVAVFRPSTGTWFFTTDINAPNYQTVSFGQNGDIPIANDYDGDSKADLTVFRPKSATWLIRQTSDGSVRQVQFGQPADKPLTGDFDGDATADLIVWRPSEATFYVLKSSDNQTVARQLGTSTDIPVPADYDGDGKTDFGVFNPGIGRWSYFKSLNDQLINVDFGTSGDIPVPGDYDGDGKNDTAIFRPNTMTWWVKWSNNGDIEANIFGLPMDIPLPGR